MRHPALILPCSVCGPVVLAALFSVLTAAGAELRWRGVVMEAAGDGSNRPRLIRESAVPTPEPEFRVFTANAWPAGLVPVFELERDGHLELRRRPPAGRENVTDPLFFALPPDTDAGASGIAGRWQIQATNAHGGRHWTFIELTADSGRVSGRFDQNTDYRYAFITGGEWGTNQLRIQVEYIQDRYELSAQVTSNTFAGTWRRPDDSERGTWAGRRDSPDPGLPIPSPGVPLWEWRHESGRRRYGIDPSWSAAGWDRQETPVCRVWRP